MGEKKIKVSFLSQVFVRNSTDALAPFLFLTCKTLLKLGLDVSVVCPHDAGLKKREIIKGIETVRFRYAPDKYEVLAYKGMMHELVFKSLFNLFIFFSFLSFFTIKSLSHVRKNKIDIIHSHWWVPTGIVGIIVSKLTGKPLIITSHGTDIFIIRKFRKIEFLARRVFGAADMITVVSNALKKRLIEDLGIKEEKIKVIPMPVDIDRFYPKKMDRNIDVLCVGRLIERKGIDILVQAIAKLRSKSINAQTVIIGNGPEKERLLELVRKNNLEGNVTFVDYVPNDKLIDYYNRSKLFVLPTVTDWKMETEGLGVVLLEALRCRAAVIGSDTGGIPDIIKDSVTGLLVEERDVEGMAEAIKKLLTDENLRENLVENGFEHVGTLFTPEKVAGQFRDVYRCLLQK